MDRLRTLLLARTHTVVMDPDRVADAATRPIRDADADLLEDQLAQLGYVMSLDLALTCRRLPREASQQLHAWMIDTLRVPRPQVALGPADGRAPYLRRMLSWLGSSPAQPCPWCAEVKQVGALDPCGHLVCRTCWEGGAYGGCPICHRRTAIPEPFARAERGPRVTGHSGVLALLHLGFDMEGLTRERIRVLLSRTAPPSARERAELEDLIDAVGPRALAWLPAHIPHRARMAIAVARLWLIAPDRAAICAATAPQLLTATDVLRVAAVVMGGNPELAAPFRLKSPARRLRTSLLEALERLPAGEAISEVRRRAGLWKRVGEQLHPYEAAARFPNAARVFAIARGSEPPAALGVHVVRERPWAGPIEDALRDGDARAAVARLIERPAELLRRIDHVARVAQARQPDAMPQVLAALEQVVARGSAAGLLVLASHIARRGVPWPRRVILPRGRAFAAWAIDDRRAPLRADAIGAIAGAVRTELVARARARRHFPRAVLDRTLGDLPLPLTEWHRAGWPRGSELALPVGHEPRLVIDPPGALTVVGFDASWRHVATMSSPELHLEQLHQQGVRHVVVATAGAARIELASLGFQLPRTRLAIPLAIDLPNRHVHWLDVAISDRSRLARAGGFRAMLAHVARDLADLAASRARPTLWDAASIHAATRANIVYVRERDGGITTYRRREGESVLARLSRLMSGGGEDGRATAIPQANAPTWFALVHADLALPAGSVGFAIDGPVEKLAASDLVRELEAVTA